MQEYCQKKLKTEKILHLLLIAVEVLWICFFLLLLMKVQLPVVVKLLWVDVGFPLLIALLIAYMRLRRYRKNAKWLKAKGYEDEADDIDLSAPTLPRSKIYCGSKAMFSKRSGVIIPYREFLWVYKRENIYNGITVHRGVVIRLRSGGTYEIKADDQEIKWMLTAHVLPASPDLVVGYGTEQKQRFRELRSGAENRK